MAPELREGVMVVTAKADVYSFGVLMLEIASRRRPSWPVKEEGHEVRLVRWARKRIEEGCMREILDPRMEVEEEKLGELEGFMAVAYKCTEENMKKRPSMQEVV
jgi:Protein tyrosine and serine/threonine kinase